jgi:hypothetical protein
MISEGFLLKCYAETGNRRFLQRAKAIARSKRFSQNVRRFDGIEMPERNSSNPLAECIRTR